MRKHPFIMSSNVAKPAGGRPPKFKEPSRPITVTLPDRILQGLASINDDRAQAIVKVVELALGMRPEAKKAVEVVQVVPGFGLIVVGPCDALRRVHWLRMVEISPARYLLVLPSGYVVEMLEVAILDLLDQPDVKDQRERMMLESLLKLLTRMRRGAKVSKAELLFISMKEGPASSA
jgi:hypothetical protein